MIDWIKSKFIKIEETSEEVLAYNPLSPSANADNEKHYTKALNWALKSRKKNDIKNIALTGPYGSGKSSILKTFRENYIGNDLNFLSISLATFKEENQQRTEPSSGEELLRLIELSILQQIFYYEEDAKIPDSRFKKIKNYKKWRLFIEASGLVLFILALLNITNPDLIKVLTNIKSFKVFGFIYYTSIVISIGGLYFILLRSIRTLYRIKINKLNFNNAEVELGGDLNKSILNHHIDEIIYFFEVRPYNVVIIEDLDRFEQTEIFTKLREINLLINNSKKVKQEVVFIYAVRDDIFIDKERTKFFDFIIPVIPVINSSNSKEIFLDNKNRNKYNLSDDLIENISLFIDDMRLLYNITNEFYIYYQHLNKSLSQDKLLSILTYKNIFPTDFAKLSENDGQLYYTINKKKSYISQEISKIEGQIFKAREEISDLEKLKIKDVKELRRLYLLEYIIRLPLFKSFHIQNEGKKLDSLLDDNIFEYFLNDEVYYEKFYNIYSYSSEYRLTTEEVKIKFEDIEGYVDPNNTYLQRKKNIDNWNDGKIEFLKGKIQDYEKDKFRVRSLRIKDLINKGYIEFEIYDDKQNSLITLLLRNGYIDEDYLDYISIFYEGSITKADNQFLLNVKSRILNEFNYKLTKIDKLIERIQEIDFESHFVLNFNLLDFILENPQLKSQHDLIFTQLANESDTSIQFIDEFLGQTSNIERFVFDICVVWPKIWSYIDLQSNYPNNKKDEYFKFIIDFSSINDIKKIAKGSSFSQNLSNKKGLVNLGVKINKLKLVLKELDIKVVDITGEDANDEIFKYIYQNNLYDIRTLNISTIIKAVGIHNQVDFDQRNYFSILQSDCNYLVQYINSNISYYIDNVYLKIETNVNEEEESLLLLLNNKLLSFNQKIKIVRKTKTKIKDISTVNEQNVIEALLKESRVLPNWENVFKFYLSGESKITENLVGFINNLDNATELARVKIPVDKEGEQKYKPFIISLIKTEGLDNSIYELVLNSIPYIYPKLDVKSLSADKVSLLIKCKILVFNPDNYSFLKDNFKGLHITFIESKKNNFFTKISDYQLDQDDILALLKSTSLTGEEKNILIEKVDEELIKLNYNSIKEIGELILKNSAFRISKTLINLILLNPRISTVQKIKIFNLKHALIDKAEVTNFLNALPLPYPDITLPGKRPKIDNYDFNLRLAEIMYAKRYISKFIIEGKIIRIYTFKNVKS